MARLRIAEPAHADLESILSTSLARWGEAGRSRYAALLAVAMRSVARDLEGSLTRDRSELIPGIRSSHIRHARGVRGVKDPVHVVFYRVVGDVVEIVRVLHEAMEPTRQLEDP